MVKYEPLSYFEIKTLENGKVNIIKELLVDHSYNVAQFVCSRFLKFGFDKMMQRVLRTLVLRREALKEIAPIIRDSVIIGCALHDSGKSYRKYQENLYQSQKASFSGHEAISAVITYSVVKCYLEQTIPKNTRIWLQHLDDVFSRIIAITVWNHHHTMTRREEKKRRVLNEFKEALEKANWRLERVLCSWPGTFSKVIERLKKYMSYPDIARDVIESMNTIKEAIRIFQVDPYGRSDIHKSSIVTLSNVVLYLLITADNIVAMESRGGPQTTWEKVRNVLEVREEYSKRLRGFLADDNRIHM